MDNPQDIRTLPTDNQPITQEEEYIINNVFTQPKKEWSDYLRDLLPSKSAFLVLVLVGIIFYPINIPILKEKPPRIQYIIKVVLCFLLFWLITAITKF